MSRERQNKMYDWHRIFVQAIMSRGIMTGSEVFSLVRDICEEFKGRPGFPKINLSASPKEVNQDIAELIEELYTVANYSLEKIQFQIKKGFEETKTDSQYVQYYTLVPTEENEQIAKLQKNMTEPELELLKLICIHLIEDRPDKTDTETNLINQCIKGGNNASKKKLTQLEAAKTLKGFIAEGYLTKRGTRAQKGGRIGLGGILILITGRKERTRRNINTDYREEG
ncbi:uncharacterized protein LOC111707335 isoform X2 [Eurytemora carolleeae]|uniref:uncharacterized protein LOC111707335 isoform X2 n=1 Tax=Eurytemora carolleeae TaxID=1294199 RepID=UPI000C77FBBD|nr:uncharacterized protein LOC111707335 isoform X2 [Eurytemora carolleeae]|eukprot:XP_023336191.1 uncharacterized protein LOC111707335 isoform X2 [Eurytemora affinis]